MVKTLKAMVLMVGLTLAATGCTNSGPTGPGDVGSTDGAGDGGGSGGGGGGSAGEASSSVSSLRVVNQSSLTVWYLYVSPSTSSSWGPDQLGSHVISPGGTFTVNDIPCGRNYDLKIEGAGHTTLATRYGVYFSCGSTMSWRLTGG